MTSSFGQNSMEEMCAISYSSSFNEIFTSMPARVQLHISEIRRLNSKYHALLGRIKDLQTEYLVRQIPSTSTSTTHTLADCDVVSQLISDICSAVECGRNTTVQRLLPHPDPSKEKDFSNRIKRLLLQCQIIQDAKNTELKNVNDILEFHADKLDADSKRLSRSSFSDLEDEQLDPLTTPAPLRLLDQDCERLDNLERDQTNNTRESSRVKSLSLLSKFDSESQESRAKLQEEVTAKKLQQKEKAAAAAAAAQSLTPREGNKRPRRANKLLADWQPDCESPKASPAQKRERSTNSQSQTSSANNTGQSGGKRKGPQVDTSGDPGSKGIKSAASKRRKVSKDETALILDPPVCPDEPLYCVCKQVSYGEMVSCDNDACILEWFHFDCVNLTRAPKGKWYCPECRGDKHNVMKQK